MKQHRSRQLSELFKRDLAEILSMTGEFARGKMITVTEVRLTKDLNYADVWLSIFGEYDIRLETIKFLSNHAGKIRHELAKRVYQRRVPELRFELDASLDHAEKIDKLLADSNIDFSREDKPDDD